MSIFKPIDRHLAGFALKGRATPETEQLLAYLSAALRTGYPSIVIDGSLTPSPEALREEEDPSAQGEALGEDRLHAILKKGLEQLLANPLPSVVIEGKKVSFELYHTLHTQFKMLYQKHLETPPELPIPCLELKGEIHRLITEGTITPEQGEAIEKGCTQSTTLISGGPGTGKTYTAGILLRTFWSLLRNPNCKIALTAPTGKAAANLQKSFHKFSQDLPGLKGVQGVTLHALLRLGRSREPKPIDADLVIVDESSMIDTKRMVDLLSALKPGARLILMGDPHQLPPVEVGGLFAELIRQSRPEAAFLTKCQRTELLSIVQMAQAILEGRFADIRTSAELEPFFGSILESYTPPPGATPEELLTFFNRFRILSPLNKGPWGCETLNSRLLDKLLRPGHPLIAPILITKNDRHFNLNNGEVGVLVVQSPGKFQEGDFAYFEGSDAIRKIPAAALPPHAWAFCLSVHKSQGSEFERVILLWPEGAQKFGRPGLYTGVTRAKKQIDLICLPETLKSSLKGA